MKSKVIAVLMSGLVATTGFAGERHKTQKEESIGLGSGAAIGAIAGGPIGLVIGAAFGGWLGDRFHHERKGRLAAEQQFDEADAQAKSLATALATGERTAAAKDAALYDERLAHRRDLEEALSVEVFFRTEESALSGATEERLVKLAGLIGPMEGAVIRLEGHTDARGTEEFNAGLSSARAEAVRDALVRAGLPPERIVVTAAGEAESAAAPEDVDGMALDRRVQMSVVDLDGPSRVAQQTTN
jgi:outer membrane protein OmpA-like peptidoglycan-associated protein